MDDQGLAEDPTGPATDAEPADVEAHSLAVAMGIDQLGRSRNKSRSRQSSKDEELTPLSKPFPRMKKADPAP